MAPAIAGALFLFLLDPAMGGLAFALRRGLGLAWDPTLDSTHATILVVLAAAWKQVAYNFVFFLAGLQAIPRILIEAAALDGAGPWQRLVRVTLPLLPGDRLLEKLAAAWQRAELGRALLNSTLMASGIAAGKIALAVLSAFALVYFRLRLRRLALWAIFASLMLPVEVRIVPTFEVVANVLVPVHTLAGWLGLAPALAAEGAGAAAEVSLLNSYAGLILPLTASATATFLFRQVFSTVPEEPTEAALLAMAPPVLVVLLFQRAFVRGLIEQDR